MRRRLSKRSETRFGSEPAGPAVIPTPSGVVCKWLARTERDTAALRPQGGTFRAGPSRTRTTVRGVRGQSASHSTGKKRSHSAGSNGGPAQDAYSGAPPADRLWRPVARGASAARGRNATTDGQGSRRGSTLPGRDSPVAPDGRHRDGRHRSPTSAARGRASSEVKWPSSG
jgi:hypothetical protein